MTLEYGYTKFQNEIGRDGKEYRLAIRIRRIDNQVRRAADMGRHGFTLVELMLIVSIIGILSAIAIPRFAGLTIKARESVTKGNLGVLRSALSIYYGDMEGWYPTDALSSLVPRYLTAMPLKDTPPYHPKGNSVSVGTATDQITSTGDWFYFNTPFGADWGHIEVNCIHQDLKGINWSTY